MQGRNGAISVIALAERGALFDPGPCMYMEKLAGEPCQASIYAEEPTKQLSHTQNCSARLGFLSLHNCQPRALHNYEKSDSCNHQLASL
jgi:hypothetical protein